MVLGHCHHTWQQEMAYIKRENLKTAVRHIDKIWGKSIKLLAKWADGPTLTPHQSQSNYQLILKTLGYIYLTTYNMPIFFQGLCTYNNKSRCCQSTLVRAYFDQNQEPYSIA